LGKKYEQGKEKKGEKCVKREMRKKGETVKKGKGRIKKHKKGELKGKINAKNREE
jgi:hypothetical protein